MTRQTPPAVPVRLVAMVASAGGFNALKKILSALPADFPVPIVVVQHLEKDRSSLLARLLAKHTRLRIKDAEEAEHLEPGCIYLGVSGHDFEVGIGEFVSLSLATRIKSPTPSADVLLTSLATAFGEGVVAVVLSGMGDDGGAGAKAIKQAGGYVIAQDQATSAYFGMPSAAIRCAPVDQILPLDDIAAALLNRVH